MTSQRTVVLEYLRSVKNHPSAREVYEAVRERLPSISLATVYRTLAWLRDNGKALELKHGDKASRYDADTAEHSHFTCAGCGRVLDVSLPVPKVDARQIMLQLGAELHGRRLEVTGLCKECLNKEEKHEHH